MAVLQDYIKEQMGEQDQQPLTPEAAAEKDAAKKREEINEYISKTDNREALVRLQKAIVERQGGLDEVWETGFGDFDRKLDGGFMGEQLIFLGAISSLGKTSYALQLAVQMAERGHDVLIFSLEMSQNELNAKMISRYSHILSLKDRSKAQYRFTTRDILRGKIGEKERARFFMESLEAAERISDHIHIYVGENNVTVDEIKRTIETHIDSKKLFLEERPRLPFVIIDYLQILKPSESAETTDKRLLTDYDVTQLKVLARDLKIPILAISAFNRTNYLEPVSMGSFKESSGIEYSSDILLAMQYQGMDYQLYNKTLRDGTKSSKKVYESKEMHNYRIRGLMDKMDKEGAAGNELPVEVKILKNRNGPKGTLYYNFLPAYNFYQESHSSSYQYIEPTQEELEGIDDDVMDAVVKRIVDKSNNVIDIGEKVR